MYFIPRNLIRKTLPILTALLLPLSLGAQKVSEFKETVDSLSTLLKERTTVRNRLVLKSVSKSGSYLDFAFSESIGDLPWRSGDVSWFKNNLQDLLPMAYSSYRVGNIYCGNRDLSEMVISEPGSDGSPQSTSFQMEDMRGKYLPLVQKADGKRYSKGLADRHIALWQSHGKFYNQGRGKWEWQRTRGFLTVEDMFTQSFVLPFLIPMLENAGACVMTPRERDTQTNEVICDNDPAFNDARGSGVRGKGAYSESGKWEDAGVGFADAKKAYSGSDNPFTMGTARKAQSVNSRSASANARWTPDIPQRGFYSVYVSYKTVQGSTAQAHYTVEHMGGKTEFYVNQQMGGGTWIYLGTFEFDKGKGGCVYLDNYSRAGGIVTADAVRFGGGMGKIARGGARQDRSLWKTSGLPSYIEGAIYWMQWAGSDPETYQVFRDDYTNDYATRGNWVQEMAGGSWMIPGKSGRNIPIDLSLAWHTDAGITSDESIIGTLSIYTLLSEGSDKFANGTSREASRELADYVQTQVTQDIRRDYNPDWTRRMLWNRNYAESRNPGVPAMILELLSHQNFADMTYGLDPAFRFTVARSVYKGILKFLSNRYACRYVVEPLPVTDMSVVPLDNGKVRLSWTPVSDPAEPTANPTGYILYTRVDNGAFDTGVDLGSASGSGRSRHTDIEVSKGHIYSYRIEAYNEGGKSFPSHTVCIGSPRNAIADRYMMVLDNFDRVAPPAWFDDGQYAGFTTKIDIGVPWGEDIYYIGEQYKFQRDLPWVSEDNPGFGASFDDMTGMKIKGNTFDFIYTHGKAMMDAGFPFCSAQSSAFASDKSLQSVGWAIDILCGKQVSTPVGKGAYSNRHEVFPIALQKAVRAFTQKGGAVMVSGAYIGTDVWDKVYSNLRKDAGAFAQTQSFVEDILGYKWMSGNASKSGSVWIMKNDFIDVSKIDNFSFYNSQNGKIYYVEAADGIAPAGDKSQTFLRYEDTGLGAGVCYRGARHRAVSLGFPLEVIKDDQARCDLVRQSLYFLGKAEEQVAPSTPEKATEESHERDRRRNRRRSRNN